MAKRTRLGRDPLEKASPSPTRATGRKAPKKAAASQGPTPEAPAKKTARPAKRAAAPSETAVAAGHTPVQDDLTAALPDPAVAAAPAEPMPDVVVGDAVTDALPEASEPAAVGQPLVQDDLADTVSDFAAPLPDVAEPALTPPAAPASADCLPPSQPQAEPADSLAATRPAETTDHDGPTGQIPLCQGEHALTLFFRGVLDAFLPDDPQALRVVVDAGSAAVPLEKLLFFSQVLHRIVFPTARPDQFAGRSGADCGPLPVLTVRLAPGAGDRHVLELFDNGRYFRERWPHPDLGLKALEPLTAYVVAHGGSIQLAKGHCAAFAVTG